MCPFGQLNSIEFSRKFDLMQGINLQIGHRKIEVSKLFSFNILLDIIKYKNIIKY